MHTTLFRVYIYQLGTCLHTTGTSAIAAHFIPFLSYTFIPFYVPLIYTFQSLSVVSFASRGESTRRTPIFLAVDFIQTTTTSYSPLDAAAAAAAAVEVFLVSDHVDVAAAAATAHRGVECLTVHRTTIPTLGCTTIPSYSLSIIYTRTQGNLYIYTGLRRCCYCGK